MPRNFDYFVLLHFKFVYISFSLAGRYKVDWKVDLL